MKQEHFEKKNQRLWDDYTAMTAQFKKSQPSLEVNPAEFPSLYRKICNHYAISLTRQYSPALVTRLHDMVLAGHKMIYKKASFKIADLVLFFSRTFPRTFRSHLAYFIVALLLFLVPGIGTGITCYKHRDVIYTIMGDEQVSQFEYMYDPANRAYGRTEDKKDAQRIAMFGFYIYNNISIGFRTFAGGILAGTGTVFALLFNGVHLGAVSGHVTRLGFTETFWPFVSGHGAFELTAIIISGMAGLILARAVIAPGNLKRADALKLSARTALTLMLGAASMLVIAAFIEAFWSPSSIDNHIKYIAATVFWALVVQYLAFAGKKSVPGEEDNMSWT